MTSNTSGYFLIFLSIIFGLFAQDTEETLGSPPIAPTYTPLDVLRKVNASSNGQLKNIHEFPSNSTSALEESSKTTYQNQGLVPPPTPVGPSFDSKSTSNNKPNSPGKHT